MIVINSQIKIFTNEIKFQAIRSGGPGGQHVNKVSTAVILKYDVSNQPYPEWFLNALKKNLNSSQLSNDKVITIKSSQYRSQKRNKEDAINRLTRLFKKSCERIKYRRKTHPTKKSKEKRLLTKKINSEKKSLRKKPNIYD
ncbi:MAG: hypothetical protein CMG23_03590 [Candidatus Marinimicrobia bacterium]|nr:hypothetical protein [Candidatus Neomarinimicrobiota bacterium]|tara:strand:- start:363 stop:785 length:423 start_codon:yes stop_codon:yes gene_type:complete